MRGAGNRVRNRDGPGSVRETMAIIQGAITIALFILILGGLVRHPRGGPLRCWRAVFRIRVLEFGIGFPPRAKVLRARGETLYTLNWLPIGGFVRLEGEDGDSEDPRSFAVQRLWKKLVVLVAGVGMNLLLAFVIFFSIAWLATPQGGLTFAEVTAGSPAEAAGLVAGDTIVAIDGQTFDLFPSPDAGRAAIEALRERAGETVTLTVVGDDGAVRERPGDAAAAGSGRRQGCPGHPRGPARLHRGVPRTRHRLGDRGGPRVDGRRVHPDPQRPGRSPGLDRLEPGTGAAGLGTGGDRGAGW